MGITYVEATLSGANGQQAVVEFLIDSGAGYTLVPHGVWQELGLERRRREAFRLADGTVIEREMGECRISLLDQETHTPVILGQPGDEPLLGTVTLEELGLVLNPFTRTLHPMRMLLV